MLLHRSGAARAALGFFLGLGVGTARSAPISPEDAAFFERSVRPVLIERCYKCHSRAAEKVKGGLLLDSRSGVGRGGVNGAVIVPGDPGKSALVKAVRREDADLEMPPDEKLPPHEIAALEAWVKRGAPDPRDDPPPGATGRKRRPWAFGPLTEPAVPEVIVGSPAAGPIDRFILARLREKALAPVGRADRHTLVRRATFDLTGLPPTPEEVDAFVADDSPYAWQRLIDRLLASARYGERWGRHWLDLVRYAETDGASSDFPVPQAVGYRDYVISAFNEDLPYDQFLREQIAGDLLPAADENQRYRRIQATGYLALARRFGIKPEDFQHLTIDDAVENLGRTALGLGLGCARCHDHKFDPISQEDYYAIYGIFASTRFPFTGSEERKFQVDFVPLASAQTIERLVRPFLDRLALYQIEIDRMSERVATAGTGPGGAPLKREIKRLGKERDAFVFAKRPDIRGDVRMAYAVSEGTAVDASVQIKGDPKKLGRHVPRGFPGALGGQILPAGETHSGRLQLASWITDARNPLTARVMVNRIWQHHFGTGIVATPSDFGARAVGPTHPELLDYLARRFVQSGWSIKAMHRLVMSSEAYQRAADSRPDNTRVDPANSLLWRQVPRRLEAESIRDAMLAVSGDLDLTSGGGHAFPPEAEWDFSQAQPYGARYEELDHRRRSIYWMTQRLRKRPFMEIFQGADPNAPTPVRLESTTPLQALYLMNSQFVHERAARLAARVTAARSADRGRVALAYRLAFARDPTTVEQRAAREYLRARGSLASLCHALLASNEFLFVD